MSCSSSLCAQSLLPQFDGGFGGAALEDERGFGVGDVAALDDDLLVAGAFERQEGRGGVEDAGRGDKDLLAGGDAQRGLRRSVDLDAEVLDGGVGDAIEDDGGA